MVAPAPVLLPPPQSAINIPRFYYPRGLPVPGPPANHDAAIAAAEAAFTEFDEEKADIYEMAKIAKVSVRSMCGVTGDRDARPLFKGPPCPCGLHQPVPAIQSIAPSYVWVDPPNL